MFVVESTNIFPLRTRFDIFSCFGWDWKLCFDVCKMSVTSTVIAKLCYKTSSKKFAIQYFLWLIAGWILTGSYNFFKSFSPFSNLCVKATSIVLENLFEKECFFAARLPDFWHWAMSRTWHFQQSPTIFNILHGFPFFLFLKFGFFFFNTVRIQTTYSYNIWLKAKLGHTQFLGLGLKSCS